MSYITAIGIANPAYRFAQSTIADFMMRAMDLNNGDHRKLKAVFRASGIEFRHSVLEDYGKVAGFTFYADTGNLEPFPGTRKRLEVFRANALSVSVTAVKNMIRSYPLLDPGTITHLVVVCCTGMYAPGLDVDLVQSLALSPRVHRTAINFMGCQAAFNAMKIADACCRSDRKAKVLIVCTELCSLHFQRAATDDNILANALFADGSAALLVEAATQSSLRLGFEQFHSTLATEGHADMAWTVGDLGFEMRLSSYVPDLIRKGIADLAKTLLAAISARLEDIRYFAIHPGGKKILQAIEDELSISKDKNAVAYDVLRNYGNMSSATVLFVLKQVIDQLDRDSRGHRILAMAFGPGLTLESMILKIENAGNDA